MVHKRANQKEKVITLKGKEGVCFVCGMPLAKGGFEYHHLWKNGRFLVKVCINCHYLISRPLELSAWPTYSEFWDTFNIASPKMRIMFLKWVYMTDAFLHSLKNQKSK